jgi:hypothetical protein
LRQAELPAVPSELPVLWTSLHRYRTILRNWREPEKRQVGERGIWIRAGRENLQDQRLCGQDAPRGRHLKRRNHHVSRRGGNQFVGENQVIAPLSVDDRKLRRLADIGVNCDVRNRGQPRRGRGQDVDEREIQGDGFAERDRVAIQARGQGWRSDPGGRSREDDDDCKPPPPGTPAAPPARRQWRGRAKVIAALSVASKSSHALPVVQFCGFVGAGQVEMSGASFMIVGIGTHGP